MISDKIQQIKEYWVVVCDCDNLEVMKLGQLVKSCRHSFTAAKSSKLTLPIMSIWPTQNEAIEDMEKLKPFSGE